MPGAPPHIAHHEAEDPKTATRRTSEHKRLRGEIKSKRSELRGVRERLRAAKDPAEIRECQKEQKKVLLDILQLKEELRASKEGAASEPGTGALPDFIVIGAQKGGTTYLYHLLIQHPLVEPAAKKELHFFDRLFDLGVEWYRRCFPQPKLKDGRRIITGEATPYYLFHPHAARRIAEVVPEARLIALLRNPVERAYSHYQMVRKKGKEQRATFEEAIGAEEARLRGERERMIQDEYYDSLEHQSLSYLSRGVYVDQLMRWSEFFPREQMLILKSEDFFDDPTQTLKTAVEFLGLPEWEPGTEEREGKRNEGRYEQEMDPSTRRRLEEYFEPHNRRLYNFLGTDFGW